MPAPFVNRQLQDEVWLMYFVQVHICYLLQDVMASDLKIYYAEKILTIIQRVTHKRKGGKQEDKKERG